MKTTLQKATAIGNKSVHVPKEVGEGIKQTCSGDEDHKEDEGSYGSDNRELIFVQWGYLNITTKRRWFEIPNKKQKKKKQFFSWGVDGTPAKIQIRRVSGEGHPHTRLWGIMEPACT